MILIRLISANSLCVPVQDGDSQCSFQAKKKPTGSVRGCEVKSSMEKGAFERCLKVHILVKKSAIWVVDLGDEKNDKDSIKMITPWKFDQ